MERAFLFKIATGQKTLTLTERVEKALANINAALEEPVGKQNELNSEIKMTAREYLANQKYLLENLLNSSTW